MNVAGAVLTRIRALPAGWRVVLLGVAALAVVGGLLAAQELRRELHARTRSGPYWNPVVPSQADVLTVFDAVGDNTGVTGNRGNGLRMFVGTDSSNYYLALDVAKDGTSRASFFAVQLSDKAAPYRAIGPRTLAYSASETRDFLTRFDTRLRNFWGLEGPLRSTQPVLAWERTVGAKRLGGQSVAVGGRTYGEVSAEVLAFLSRRLGPAELPGPAWEWPATSGAQPAALPPLSPRSAPR